MEVSEILNNLLKYKNTEFDTIFLNSIINFYTKMNEKFITNINQVELNNYNIIVSGIRINLLYIKNDYKYYLSKTNIKNTCYKELNLSKNQLYNLSHYISSKQMYEICESNPIKLNQKMFLCITKQILKNQLEIDKHMCFGLLGEHSLKFLEYQNLDHYCENKNKSDVFNKLNTYKMSLSKLTELEQDKYILCNDITYYLAGATITDNIDILHISKTKNQLNKFEILNVCDLKETHKLNWYKNKLPKLLNIENIQTMLIDTRYHFYFMGVKCFSIFACLEKTIYDSDWYSFLDIYMLNIINKIEYFDKLCIKNIVIKDDNSSLVNTSVNITNMYNRIQKFAIEKYNISIKLSEIKNHFKRCVEKFDTIYKDDNRYIDPLIREQIGIHRKISQNYILQYSKNKQNLFDMGCGKLSGAYIYKQAGLKTVYGIEPSIYSVEAAKITAKKIHNINFNIIHGYADKPIQLSNPIKFDIITFIFSIHYMIENLDIIIQNIKNLSKNGAIIIITCINGDKILNYFKSNKTDKYEIKYNYIYWGVYKFNIIDKVSINKTSVNKEIDKYLFYMKDVYGVEMGSEEYLTPIKKLIEIFAKNKIKLLQSQSFLDEYNNKGDQKKLLKWQYDILEMQQVLVFTI